jgi:hypothetical protein
MFPTFVARCANSSSGTANDYPNKSPDFHLHSHSVTAAPLGAAGTVRLAVRDAGAHMVRALGRHSRAPAQEVRQESRLPAEACEASQVDSGVG